MSAPIRHDDFETCSSTFDGYGFDETRMQNAPKLEAIGFVAGTRVATPMGYVAAELLSVGDRVLTAEGHHARLVWVGLTRVPASGGNAPVRFDTGVLNNMRPLRLGQGHRVRVSGWRAELLFDADAVLVTAQTFVNGLDVLIDRTMEEVTYIHLMFERHEIILAENVACETLRAGPEMSRMLLEMARVATDVHLPDVETMSESTGCLGAVLPVLSPFEEMLLRAA